MTHFVVSIAVSTTAPITALNTLPPRWERNGNVFTKVTGSENIICDGNPISSCDLEIGSYIDYTYFDVGFAYKETAFAKRTDFVRQKKSFQSAIFNSVARKLDLKRFRFIQCWSNYEHVSFPRPTLLLFRPEHGARGIGQIVFNSGNISPTAIDAILQTTTKDKPVVCEEVVEVNTQKTSLEHQFKEELTRRAPSAVFTSVRDRYDGEGHEVLRQEKCLTEYVYDVSREFRLITGADGQVCYAMERDRKRVGLIGDIEIAIGCGNEEPLSNAKVGNNVLTKLDLPEQSVIEIQTFLEKINAPLQSFDLFTTHSGMWGFWETSPEFGTEAIPTSVIRNQTEIFIDEICMRTSSL